MQHDVFKMLDWIGLILAKVSFRQVSLFACYLGNAAIF